MVSCPSIPSGECASQEKPDENVADVLVDGSPYRILVKGVGAKLIGTVFVPWQ